MAGLLLFLWDRYIQKYGAEGDAPCESVVDREVCPQTWSSNIEALRAAADSYEMLSVKRRETRTVGDMISNPVNALTKRVRHRLVRLNSSERRDFSKEFGAKLRQMGDLLDKEPRHRTRRDGSPHSSGSRLQQAADEFDAMYAKH